MVARILHALPSGFVHFDLRLTRSRIINGGVFILGIYSFFCFFPRFWLLGFLASWLLGNVSISRENAVKYDMLLARTKKKKKKTKKISQNKSAPIINRGPLVDII